MSGSANICQPNRPSPIRIDRHLCGLHGGEFASVELIHGVSHQHSEGAVGIARDGIGGQVLHAHGVEGVVGRIKDAQAREDALWQLKPLDPRLVLLAWS